MRRAEKRASNQWRQRSRLRAAAFSTARGAWRGGGEADAAEAPVWGSGERDRRGAEGKLLGGEAVVDGGDPVREGERLALGVGDRDQGLVAELAVEGREVGEVEPPVEGGEVGGAHPARERVMEVVGVEMDE